MKDAIKVIYVEDEPSIARLLSSGLGLFGIDVHPIFMSAEDLLAEVDGSDFNSADILMFDIRLPKMTGVDLAWELRQRGETRPFVLVSAWPSPSKEKLAEIRATFLPKPFDFPDVVQTIQKLV
jgi:two-component system alkaline phosphatase synthesis response regulator PhoP